MAEKDRRDGRETDWVPLKPSSEVSGLSVYKLKKLIKEGQLQTLPRKKGEKTWVSRRALELLAPSPAETLSPDVSFVVDNQTSIEAVPKSDEPRSKRPCRPHWRREL